MRDNEISTSSEGHQSIRLPKSKKVDALSTKKSDDAITIAYKNELLRDPNDPVLWNNLGMSQFICGNLQDASQSFHNALILDPEYEDALNNLAHVQIKQGNELEAARNQCLAYVLKPDSHKPKQMLGTAYYVLERYEEAALMYQDWLNEDPGNPIAEHLLAACLRKEIPDKASDAFIEAHFDDLSKNFDVKMTTKLSYQIPERIGEIIERIVHLRSSLTILDAGCGTGLCGPYLAPFSRHLIGVDLSGKSLAISAEKGMYTQLIKQEIVTYLSSVSDVFDVVVAADTLIYFGRLDHFIQTATRALKKEGLLIATIEECFKEDGDFILNPSGRYSHSPNYIETLCLQYGLSLKTIAPIDIRMELGKSVKGRLIVAKRTS